MKKTYVLDTNVLLTDSRAFLTFRKHSVVIPYKVIEELEKHKYTPGEVGMTARDCARQLSDLISSPNQNETLSEGITLSSGGKLRVLSHKDFGVINNDKLGKLEHGDDFILATCVGIKEKLKENVILVSNDMLLRMRSNSFGITSQVYEINNNIQTLDDLFNGFHIVEPNDQVANIYYSECERKKYFSISPKALLNKKLQPNEFVLLTKDIKRKPFPIVRMDGRNLVFVKEKKLAKLQTLNAEQAMAADLLLNPSVNLVTLTGPSGCGKTLLSLAAGLEQVLDQKLYKNLIVIRPVHPVGKDIGYLPGDKSEKLLPWIAPINDNLRFLMSGNNDNGKKTKGNEQNLDYLFDRGLIEIEALTYIRGRSINNAFIIIDEAQNLNHHELKAILTRVGHETKIVLTGDIEQTDRTDVDSLSNGLSIAIEKFKSYTLSGHVTLTQGVRSELSALAAKIL